MIQRITQPLPCAVCGSLETMTATCYFCDEICCQKCSRLIHEPDKLGCIECSGGEDD